MMDEYYRYEYEDNGQYCYPHTHILKNKLDIHDKDELFKVEQELSSARYFELVKRPIPGDFSLDHLCAIHRYLSRIFTIGRVRFAQSIFQRARFSALLSL